MIVVDTSVWIDFFNGKMTPECQRLKKLLSEQIIVVGDLILAEILQGFQRDTDFQTAKDLLCDLEIDSMTTVDLAVKSAHYYRCLRKKGITVRKTIDCLIATYCIENQLPLLYADRDFDPFVQHFKLKTI